MFAGQLIQGGIQFTGCEAFARFYLLAPIPPVCIANIKDALRSGLNLSLVRLVFLYFRAYVFFFSGDDFCSGTGSGSPVVEAP